MKLLYLFLFIVFLVLSFLFAPIAIDTLPSFSYILYFSLFFSLLVLFFLLYTKEKNKHLAESEKKYKGLRRFGKVLRTIFIVSAIYTIASSAMQIYNLIKYCDVYADLFSSPYTHFLTVIFFSYLFITAVFFASWRVVLHFLKKWEGNS